MELGVEGNWLGGKIVYIQWTSKSVAGLVGSR